MAEIVDPAHIIVGFLDHTEVTGEVGCDPGRPSIKEAKSDSALGPGLGETRTESERKFPPRLERRRGNILWESG